MSASFGLRRPQRQTTCMVDIENWNDYTHRVQVPTKAEKQIPPNSSVNKLLSLWTGDITTLEGDAIANAANQSLLGGGGVDGAIHAAAGPMLREECAKLGGCRPGEAKLTSGHNLPSRFVIHTVGPIGENPSVLRSCYEACLTIVASQSSIRSVAFCGISTGIYGYPRDKAAHVALSTIREWLDSPEHREQVDRIVLVSYMKGEEDVYLSTVPQYFPPDD